VQVDDASYADNDGYSANNQFMIPIFNTSGLTQGPHTVSLINTGSNGQYVGVDLVGDASITAAFLDLRSLLGRVAIRGWKHR